LYTEGVCDHYHFSEEFILILLEKPFFANMAQPSNGWEFIVPEFKKEMSATLLLSARFLMPLLFWMSAGRRPITHSVY
jgi:hypothetical protein